MCERGDGRYLDLSGEWRIKLNAEEGPQAGTIALPGILQASGFGDPIDRDTPWVSSLHDPFFWEREEYAQPAGEENLQVSFCAQPPRHFLGTAFYEREFETPREAEWVLFIELTHWRTKVWIDGVYKGEDCSLCTAHRIFCGALPAGTHTLTISADNSMQYPYRPDGHGVSDALGSTWNGMAGEIALFTAEEWERRQREKRRYARAHPRTVEVKDGSFFVDGRPEYFRGTHIGGQYPLTGYPVCEKGWWLKKMETVKRWGLNFLRCHSFCPPEAAFAAADEAGVYLQPECGMWNHFEPEIPMLAVLEQETRRILEQFGHHPSFVLFSPTNEPSGDWYGVLRDWTEQARGMDEALGYAGRRLYTAQSGWFYDVPPKDVEGTDYLYFHRSAYGPYMGGKIRGEEGWRGRDYTPSLEGVKLPVICHEMGQWTAYPDFSVIDKFTGFLRPGHYRLFRENAARNGLEGLNRELAFASGRNQLRLYREDVEANLRTSELAGFEMLDLHDYLGQGGAFVGLLDAFWEEKGYASPGEFRRFCGDTVLLARLSSYVFRKGQRTEVPVEICRYAGSGLRAVEVKWKLEVTERGTEARRTVCQGVLHCPEIPDGGITRLGTVPLSFEGIEENRELEFSLKIDGLTQNSWKLYCFGRLWEGPLPGAAAGASSPCYTRSWREARAWLEEGRNVIYSPHLSDLGYECPPTAMRNVIWNSQMGPTWGRNQGLLIRADSPLFADFPTEKDGGWQWEEILSRARAFCMREMPGIEPLVRVIDDWNRNLPLALVWEARVERGNLLMVSADLESDPEKRPAASALLRALVRYASSPDFAPTGRAECRDVEAQLFPTLRMERITAGASVRCGTEGAEEARGEDAFVLSQASPNSFLDVRAKRFPIRLELHLHEKTEIAGLLYVPAQRCRMRDGFPKDYEIQAPGPEGTGWVSVQRGTFRNSSLSQRAFLERPCLTDRIRLCVLSCYGGERGPVWEEDAQGYHRVMEEKPARALLSCLHVIGARDAGARGQHLEADASDRIFWDGSQQSATKEIEA